MNGPRKGPPEGKAKIAVTSRSFSSHPILRSELLREFPETIFNDVGPPLENQRLVDFIGDASGAIVSLEKVTDTVLGSLPGLRVIAKYGVGIDNLDQAAMQRRGVALGWTGGLNKRGVSEMTLAFMIGLCRQLFMSARLLRDGADWTKRGGVQLSGRTVGIIGVGFVGKDLIELLKPFGCRILVNDILDQRDYYAANGLIAATKEQIYAEADIVTVHTPLDDTTRGMINADAFRRMKRSAYFINAARGPIVVQDDLKHALKTGEIAGAAIDVFDVEPCADMELLGLPNLYCTPHTGGSAEESVLAMGRSAIGHLKDFFKGAN
jgi:phosphoglycerate dehydrogenase-like enzyme